MAVSVFNADDYFLETEPNNTTSSADNYQNGGIITGQISTKSDNDFYKVTTQGAADINVNFFHAGDDYYANYNLFYVQITDSYGVVLNSTGIYANDQQTHFGFNAAMAGDYFINVTGCQSGNSCEFYGTYQYKIQTLISPITDTFTIGGSVTGLSGSGLVLQNSGGDDEVIAGNGAFTFDTPLAGGSAYSVTVKTQPSSPIQTCSVTNGSGTLAGEDITDVTVSCSANTTNNELSNIATRADVGTGNDIAIAGFIITGSGQKCVIVRGRGPSVGVPAGVTRLPDPTLTLKSGQTTIAENDNWTQQDNPDHVAIIEGLGKTPGDLLDAAIYICLDPGAYTVLVRGYLGTTGVGIVEVLDLTGRQ